MDKRRQRLERQLGVPLQRMCVPLSLVYCDYSYQRPLDPVRTLRKAEQLRAGAALGEGLLARRPDGSCWIVDGQHRVAAARLCGLHEMEFLSFDSDGAVQEATVQKAFSAQQLAQLRARLSPEPGISQSNELPWHSHTRLVNVGRPQPIAQRAPINAPVVRASTVLFADSAALEAAKTAGRGSFFYGRFGSPTVGALELALCELEGGDHAIVVPSGLAAAMAAIRAFVHHGDHVLLAPGCFGALRRACGRLREEAGIEVGSFDPDNPAAAITPRTRAMFVQNPSSERFAVLDIPALAACAKRHSVRLIVDNTWASPLYCRPLELGADVVVHSLSKVIGGHDDLVMGAAVCAPSAYLPMKASVEAAGYSVSPDDAYLALRGLRTLAVRLERQQHTAMALARWLLGRAEVRQVFHPGLQGHAGHAIFRRDFQGGGGLFSLSVHERNPHRLRALVDVLRLFRHGAGGGGFQSLATLKFAPDGDPDGSLIRLSIGLEHVRDLCSDLDCALRRTTAPEWTDRR